jgi:hypothetical protein
LKYDISCAQYAIVDPAERLAGTARVVLAPSARGDQVTARPDQGNAVDWDSQ